MQTFVNDFKCLRNLCLTLKADSLVKQIDDILHRIASDSFSIAVVGEFKRGKSTFINALSGKNPAVRCAACYCHAEPYHIQPHAFGKNYLQRRAILVNSC